MATLYALLVGIDRYPIRPLEGCVNDVRAWQAYLESLVGDHRTLRLEALADEEATRRRILETFRAHLTAARSGDTALFCFSGHGSQELTPPPYAAEEPGGLSETLVAYDSRLPNGLDLADKELGVLIAEVARGGAHVVIVLDSCHSGTATRWAGEEPAVRRMATPSWPRPEGSYWFQDDVSVPAELDAAGGWRLLPAGRHVLLAACEDYQKARECTAPNGLRRGLFSFCLLEALRGSGPAPSYRQLHKQVQIRVANLLPEQTPQAEGDLDRLLFEGTLPPRPPSFYIHRGRDGSLRLDAGVAHGLQKGCELAVLPPEATASRDFSKKLATAQVVEVGIGDSLVELLDGRLPELPPAHPAVLTHLPFPPLRVAVEDTGDSDAAIERGIERSPYLSLAPKAEGADVIVQKKGGDGFHLRRPLAVADLSAPLSPLRTGPVVAALEHIARWQTLSQLANPANSQSGAMDFTVWEWVPPSGANREPELRPLSTDGEIQLPYREAVEEPESDVEGETVPRRFCVLLENRSRRSLYYAVLALDESFAVKVLGGATGRLPAGETVWVRRSDGIDASVPDRFHRHGVTRRRDLLVLLASTEATDFDLLAQGGLDQRRGTFAGSRSGAGERSRGLLDTLFRRSTGRETDEQPLLVHQWMATSQAVVSHRPMPWRTLSGAGESLELGPGVLLRVPRGLVGKVRLHSPATAASGYRPGGRHLAPEAQARLRRVSLAGALGSDPGLSILELRARRGSEIVSPSHPLVLEAELTLGEGEVLVAVPQHHRSLEQLPLAEDLADDPTGNRVVACRCSISSLPASPAREESLWFELFVAQGPEAGDRRLPA